MELREFVDMKVSITSDELQIVQFYYASFQNYWNGPTNEYVICDISMMWRVVDDYHTDTLRLYVI